MMQYQPFQLEVDHPLNLLLMLQVTLMVLFPLVLLYRWFRSIILVKASSGFATTGIGHFHIFMCFKVLQVSWK